MGRHAASGSLWAFGASVLCKVFAASSVIVMSRLLSESDYGVAALSLGVAAWLVVASPVTMSDVVVSHSHRLERIAPIAQKFFWQSSLVSSIILLAGIWPSASLAPESRRFAFAAMLFTLGLRPWLESLLALRAAVLRSELRYRFLSTIDGLANFAGVCGGVGLAIVGVGPFALLAPSLATLAVRAIAFRKVRIPAASSEVVQRRIQGPLRRALIRSNAAQYVHNLVFVIDAIALGLMADTNQLGLFNFAFLVASQSNAVIGYQLGSVLQPVFVRLRGNAIRECEAYVRVIRCVGAIMIPVSAVQAASGPALFGWLFPGRWIDSLPAFMILSLAQGFYFAVHPTMAFMKSRRRFRALLLWQIGHGVLAFAVLIPVAKMGGATWVAAASSGLWALSVSVAALLSIPKRATLRTRIITSMTLPWIASVPAALLLAWASTLWRASLPPWLCATVTAGAGGVLCLVLIVSNRWLNPTAWADISVILSGVWNRARAIASRGGR